MITWNIRNQILGTGFIGLLVIVGVISYFYSFAKSEFVEHSEALAEDINGHHAQRVQQAFDDQSRALSNWRRDDVFGLAIEFNATDKLNGQMNEWLHLSDAFQCLALVDDHGRVLQIRGAAAMGISTERYRGTILPDWPDLRGSGKAEVRFLQSQLLSELGLDDNRTFVGYIPARSSDGRLNGAFVAYTNWSPVAEMVEGCAAAIADQEFDSGHCLLAFKSGQGTLLEAAVNSAGLDQNYRQRTLNWLRDQPHDGIFMPEIDGHPVLADCQWLKAPSMGEDNSAGETLLLATLIPEKEILRHLDQAMIRILLIGALGIMIVFAVNYFVARRISRRVARGTAVATAMAQGDIEQEVKIGGGDEIGRMGRAMHELRGYMAEMSAAAEKIANRDLTVAITPRSERDVLGRSFETMTQNLSGVVAGLSDSAEQLLQAAAMISENSGDISNGVQDQVGQINQVSAAIEEMAVTIQQSSRNAQVATEASKGASETAVTGGTIVTETIGGMQCIADVVRASAQTICDLAESADQIGEITRVIDEIADQTNLLALNAAIEAARAGEQGRGFAVVADEVRKLAERTGQATGEITAMIKGIQGQTEQAVESMEAGVQEVDKGRVLVDRAGASLSEIVGESQKVMDMIQQIATAAEEQAAAAEEVSRNVDNISEVTENTARRSDQSAEAARKLNAQAEELNAIVARFRL